MHNDDNLHGLSGTCQYARIQSMQLIQALQSSNQQQLILAPLASIGHRAFRELLEHYGGCDYYFNEMLSAEALGSGSPYEHHYLDNGPCPEKIIFQIIGANKASIVQAAERISGIACAGIDLNMGCSAPALVRKGAGVFWQDNPNESCRLVEAVRMVAGPLGVSVKLRMAEKDEAQVIRFCQQLESAGAQAITFHPRHKDDPWARPAKQKLFPLIANQLGIPLIVNGDIVSKNTIDAINISYSLNGMSAPPAVMIGRAAVRSPWIFKRITATEPEASPEDRVVCATLFHELLEKYQPQDFWLSRARRFHAFFLSGLDYGARVAAKVQTLPYAAILPEVCSYLQATPQDRFKP